MTKYYSVTYAILILVMLIFLISIISYYWLNRRKYFKKSNELSLWSIFDCRRFTFCKEVLSSSSYTNSRDETILESHVKTYIMIWNIWSYVALIIYFVLALFGAVFGVAPGDNGDAKHKVVACHVLRPIIYSMAWVAAYAILEYFMLRGLELHISREHVSKFWTKLALFGLYLVFALNVLILFIPPRFHLEDNMCKSTEQNITKYIRRTQETLWALLMFICWALFLELLCSLRRAINSMGNLGGALAVEQKELTRNLNHTVCRTSFTSIVGQIIFLISTTLFFEDASPNSDSYFYLCMYVISFALLASIINLSYNDFEQRCCPYYFYFRKTPVLLEASSVYSRSLTGERSNPTKISNNPTSSNVDISIHTTVEVQSVASSDEPIERFPTLHATEVKS